MSQSSCSGVHDIGFNDEKGKNESKKLKEVQGSNGYRASEGERKIDSSLGVI